MDDTVFKAPTGEPPEDPDLGLLSKAFKNALAGKEAQLRDFQFEGPAFSGSETFHVRDAIHEAMHPHVTADKKLSPAKLKVWNEIARHLEKVDGEIRALVPEALGAVTTLVRTELRL